MDGEELYQLYVDASGDADISVDGWDDLPETDHEIWNALADQLEMKE